MQITVAGIVLLILPCTAGGHMPTKSIYSMDVHHLACPARSFLQLSTARHATEFSEDHVPPEQQHLIHTGFEDMFPHASASFAAKQNSGIADLAALLDRHPPGWFAGPERIHRQVSQKQGQRQAHRGPKEQRHPEKNAAAARTGLAKSQAAPASGPFSDLPSLLAAAAPRVANNFLPGPGFVVIGMAFFFSGGIALLAVGRILHVDHMHKFKDPKWRVAQPDSMQRQISKLSAKTHDTLFSSGEYSFAQHFAEGPNGSADDPTFISGTVMHDSEAKGGYISSAIAPNQLRPVTVTCPVCGEGFDQVRSYYAHVQRHQFPNEPDRLTLHDTSPPQGHPTRSSIPEVLQAEVSAPQWAVLGLMQKPAVVLRSARQDGSGTQMQAYCKAESRAEHGSLRRKMYVYDARGDLYGTLAKSTDDSDALEAPVAARHSCYVLSSIRANQQIYFEGDFDRPAVNVWSDSQELLGNAEPGRGGLQLFHDEHWYERVGGPNHPSDHYLLRTLANADAGLLAASLISIQLLAST